MSRESWASTPARRRIMQANKRRDTGPELSVRRLLHAAGFRYRVDFAAVPGVRRRADVVFRREMLAIFIDGCFWHGCPDHGPKKFGINADYWVSKIAENQRRDLDTNARFVAAGWTVLRFWSHHDPVAVSDIVMSTVMTIRDKSRESRA